MLWLAVSAAPEGSDCMEQLLPRLASIQRFTSELDRRLAGEGFVGLTPLGELHRRLVDVLAAMAPGVGHAQRTVADLLETLRAMEASVVALRRLKSELGRVS